MRNMRKTFLEHFKTRSPCGTNVQSSAAQIHQSNTGACEGESKPYGVTTDGYDTTTIFNHIDVALDDCNWVDRERLKLSYRSKDLQPLSGLGGVVTLKNHHSVQFQDDNQKSLKQQVFKKDSIEEMSLNKSHIQRTIRNEFNELKSSNQFWCSNQQRWPILVDTSLFLHEQSIEEFVGEKREDAADSHFDVRSGSTQLLSTYKILNHMYMQDKNATHDGELFNSLSNSPNVHRYSFLTVFQVPSRTEQDLLEERLCAQTERILEKLLFSV